MSFDVDPNHRANISAADFAAMCDEIKKLKADKNALMKAVLMLSENPHLNLGDLIYQIREREGEGWDGPAVKSWSDACELVKKLLDEHGKGDQSNG